MTLPTPTYIGVRAESLAALLNVLNIALPDAAELVAEGELTQGTVDTAEGAFDELADRLDGLFGPTWIEDDEG